MKVALVVKFTNPVPGRERAAVAYIREVDDFAKKNAAEGICTEPKWLGSSTGENMMLVEGEYEALLALSGSPEVTKLENKGMILLQDFRSDIVVVGLNDAFGAYEEALTELNIT